LNVDEIKGTFAELPLMGTLVTDGDTTAGDQLTFTYASPKWGVVTPASGTVLPSKGKLRYTYTMDAMTEVFNDTIRYTVTDRANQSAKDSIIISINPINDNIPVIAQKTIPVPLGKASTIEIPTITDIDLPVIMNNAGIDTTIIVDGVKGVVTKPLHGTLSWITANKFTYTPNINSISVKDSFEYQILDSVN